MLGNIFCWKTDYKQRVIKKKSFLARVNKKQNVEIHSHVSSGGQGKYVNYATLVWPPVQAARSIINLSA